jgi:ABC-type polysaccharide/polyol phosphate export permease
MSCAGGCATMTMPSKATIDTGTVTSDDGGDMVGAAFDRPEDPNRSKAARVTWIRPATGVLQGLSLREVWEYRRIALILFRRQLKVRYKQTALGLAWVVIMPLVTVLVFTIVFGHLAGLRSGKIPYPVFVLSGLVLFTYISSAVQGATTRLVDDRDLVTKIYFPRVLAPLASALTPLTDLSVGLVITVIFMAVDSVGVSLAVLLTPLWLVAALVVAFGASMLFSALHVQYRDVGQIIAFVLQLWMFTSPIVYSSSSIHGAARVALALNPVTGLVDGFRWSLLAGPAPPAIDLLSVLTAVLLGACGLLYFQRVERRFADLV